MPSLAQYVASFEHPHAFPIGGPCRCGCGASQWESAEWLIHHAESWDSPFVLTGIDDTTMCAALAGPIPDDAYAREYYRTHGVDSLESAAALAEPIPAEEPMLARSLETIREAARGPRPVLASVWGPLTVAATLGGIDTFLRASIADPEFVHELLGKTTRATARYSAAALDAGATYLWIAEPLAALFSPTHFRRYGLEAIRALTHEADTRGTETILHVCGDTSHLTELLVETGAQGLSVDAVVDLADTARRVGERILVMGNLWPLELTGSSAEAIASTTREMVDSMRDHSLYIPATGCSCPAGTTPENLAAFVDAATLKETV